MVVIGKDDIAQGEMTENKGVKDEFLDSQQLSGIF